MEICRGFVEDKENARKTCITVQNPRLNSPVNGAQTRPSANAKGRMGFVGPSSLHCLGHVKEMRNLVSDRHLVFQHMSGSEAMLICVRVCYANTKVHHCAVSETSECREVLASSYCIGLPSIRRLSLPDPTRSNAPVIDQREDEYSLKAKPRAQPVQSLLYSIQGSIPLR